jgi:3-hydroxy acid dehydrogenase/malonic semialdehyde reductase
MTSKSYSQALVTGATSGIGRSVALDLSRSGYQVIATGRDSTQLEIIDSMPGIEAVELDIQDRAAFSTLLQDREIDVFVNNVGIMPPNVKFTELTLAQIDDTLDINFKSAVITTRLILPGMIERQRGHVFFLGSIAGQASFPNMALYGASKAALSSFAQTLRCDLSGTGVRVTEIVAGRVETALYRDALNKNQRNKMYAAFDAIQPEEVSQMLISVLNMPAHVDVTRFDILPTAQYVGGSGFAAKTSAK